MSEIIKVSVPASTANLGPGFDSLSLALSLFNEFTFKKLSTEEVKIKMNGLKNLPEDSTNIVYQSFVEPFKKLGKKIPGIEISIESRIPLSAGLGSSSTAIVSGLLAANTFLDKKLSNSDLLSLATRLEGHPDNCAAAMFGGLTISVSSDNDVFVSKFPWPDELLIIVVTPDFDLPTRISRELLPPKVSFGDATFNVSRTAYLLSSLLNKDWEGLKIGFQDRLHQQYRKDLVPGMDSVLQEAINKGALGATLSGAGPTLVAFSNDKNKAQQIAKSMTDKWSESKVKTNPLILTASQKGAKVESLVPN